MIYDLFPPVAVAEHYRPLLARDLDGLPQLARLGAGHRLAMRAVASVLPFRANRYVIDELIDWDRVPDDPIFQLTFPQPGMLEAPDLARMTELLQADAAAEVVQREAQAVRARLNPHPAGQLDLNVPVWQGRPLRGVQHKYRETVLFFPSAGQTCHAYCTYCFRWPQFVGQPEQKFASDSVEELVAYLREHSDVTSVLLTGGDPLVMGASRLRRLLVPLLQARLPHLATLRLGTKSLAYWPARFVTDPDADDLLRLFEEIGQSGLSLAIMAHYSHPRELETPIAQQALRRVRETGAVVRCQAPLVRHVNDDARTWAQLWRLQVRLGCVPYYMFVERDTGPRGWFGVPLARAVELYREAMARVEGLARTARGPSMSATPGKVVVDGTAEIAGERVFVLRFLQARDPDWVGRPFFARFDPQATWLDQLRPAWGEPAFFFEEALQREPRPGRWAPRLERRQLPIHPVQD
jgi:KamA family protein